MKLNYNDTVQMLEIAKVAFADGGVIDRIWDIHINVFTSPPQGGKNCGGCVNEAFRKLKEALEEDKANPLWEEWFKNGGNL